MIYPYPRVHAWIDSWLDPWRRSFRAIAVVSEVYMKYNNAISISLGADDFVWAIVVARLQ